MQKKIIALAIAGLASTAAFAQSNVTIYGIADAYVGSVKTEAKNRVTAVNSGGLSGSRLGFKGTEDLGNGLKALFTLETAINFDAQGTGVAAPASANGVNNANGNSGLFGASRQAFVGLTGGFGTAVAGRLQTTGYDWAVKYDVLAGTAISPLQNVNTVNSAAGISTFLIGATTLGSRANNAVAYISPNFAGLTVAVNHAYLTEESNTNAAGKNAAVADLLSATYANGPLSVGAVYAKATTQDANPTFAGADITDYSLGASYDFGVAKLAATYQTSKLSGTGIAGVAGDRDKALSIGVVVPVSAAGAVVASYAKNTIDSTVANDDAKAYTVAYTHGLSKRTTAYAGYNKINFDAANSDKSTLVAGVRHSF